MGTSSSKSAFAVRILRLAVERESAASEVALVRMEQDWAVGSEVGTREMLASEIDQSVAVETGVAVEEIGLEIAAGTDSGMGIGFRRGIAEGIPGTWGTIAWDPVEQDVCGLERILQHRDAEVWTVQPACR